MTSDIKADVPQFFRVEKIKKINRNWKFIVAFQVLKIDRQEEENKFRKKEKVRHVVIENNTLFISVFEPLSRPVSNHKVIFFQVDQGTAQL